MNQTLRQFLGGCLMAGLFVLSWGSMDQRAEAQQSVPSSQNLIHAQGTVTCTIENGSGYNAVFKPYKRYNCGKRAYGGRTGDFNHDGRTDAAVSMETGTGWEHVLLIFLQDSNGVLGQPTSYAGGNRSEYLAVGDFNHDGWDDVVTADYDNTISVYLQQADGTLANRVTYPTNTGPDGIAVGDVNNDTWDEIIVSLYSPTIGVFTQKADGTLNPMVIYPSAQAGYDDIETGDVNGDGRTDVVKMNGQGYANPNLMVYLQNEGGTLDAPVTYRFVDCPVEFPCGADGLSVGDVTGDGREDVILTYSYGNNIAVFEQDAAGALLPSVSYPSYESPGQLGAGDLNADNLGDVVLVHPGWMRVGVYTQQADGTLGAESLYTVPYGAGDVDIADIDGNGYPDLVMSDFEWGLIILYHRMPSPLPRAPTGKISDTTPTYQWTKVTGATQYRYQLLKGLNLVYTKTVSPTVCGETDCASTPSSVLADASYQWRVQAMLNGVWADYSGFKPFTMDAVPSGSAPSGTIYDPTPTYKWTKIIGAAQYRYQLLKGTTLVYTKTASPSICGANICSSTPTAVLADGSYKWRVQAMIGGAFAAYSPYASFSIKTIPTPKTPAGTMGDTTPTYTWSKIPGASAYRYQVMRETSLVYTGMAATSGCAATTCSNTPTVDLGYDSYSWGVQARVGGIWRPYSPYKLFTIVPMPKAGYWAGDYEDFYVTVNQNRVGNFGVYIYVNGCGSYRVSHTALVPIINKRFAFGGAFYADGTFNTTTNATGTEGLSSYYIYGCGYVSGGPWGYEANWRSSGQPLAATVDSSTGPNIAVMIEQALQGYRVVKLDGPLP